MVIIPSIVDVQSIVSPLPCVSPGHSRPRLPVARPVLYPGTLLKSGQPIATRAGLHDNLTSALSHGWASPVIPAPSVRRTLSPVPTRMRLAARRYPPVGRLGGREIYIYLSPRARALC